MWHMDLILQHLNELQANLRCVHYGVGLFEEVYCCAVVFGRRTLIVQATDHSRRTREAKFLL